MKVVIQRVSRAKVSVKDSETQIIGKGMLILLGIESADTSDDIEWLCGKISRLRIFPDNDGVMNINIIESGGEAMVVSQFTLHASTKKGNRPSYIKAANPEIAIPLYKSFIKRLQEILNKEVKSGEFGAMMDVELVNEGPVTIIIDTKNKV